MKQPSDGFTDNTLGETTMKFVSAFVALLASTSSLANGNALSLDYVCSDEQWSVTIKHREGTATVVGSQEALSPLTLETDSCGCGGSSSTHRFSHMTSRSENATLKFDENKLTAWLRVPSSSAKYTLKCQRLTTH